MKGTLAEGVLPGVLRALYVGRETGILHFSRGTERHGLLFQDGKVVSARSDVEALRLGEMLVRLGWLAETDRARAAWLVAERGLRMGEALLDLALLEKDRIDEALALHVREVLHAILAWNGGDYDFEEMDPGSPREQDATVTISTGELILESVRHVEDPDVVRYALGNLDRTLMLSSDPLLRFQKVPLSPVDGYILSRVDGVLTAREVIQLAPVDEREADKALLGLYCTGIVEYGPELPLRKRPAAAPAVASTPSPAAAPEGKAAAPSPAAPLPPVESEETKARRRDILETHEGLKKRDHYEVMGVPRDATLAQIKDAYFGLAKRFHPDAHLESPLSDLHGKLEAVFIRLGEVYEVLKNPAARARYDARLEPLPSPLAPAAAQEPTADAAYLARMAVENLRKAEKHMEQGEFWDAIRLLESAIPHLTGKPKQRARVDLAKALRKNPHWIKEAERMLESALEEDPKNVTAHFEIAVLYKELGLKNRALTHLRKALELQPDHEEAQAILSSLAPEPAESAPEGGGLLKRLFGRH
jgi:tetratricopeptide (TPR) repeat protein